MLAVSAVKSFLRSAHYLVVCQPKLLVLQLGDVTEFNAEIPMNLSEISVISVTVGFLNPFQVLISSELWKSDMHKETIYMHSAHYIHN